MPVTTIIRSVTYSGNGSTSTPYTVTFPYDDADDVKLLIDGVASTAFTLSGDELRTDEAVDAGSSLVIYRDTPITQEQTFPSNTTPAAENVRAAVDKLTLIAQEQEEEIDRSIKTPIGTSFLSGTTLGVDASGDPVARTPLEQNAHQGITGKEEAAASAAAAAKSAENAAESAASVDGMIDGKAFGVLTLPKSKQRLIDMNNPAFTGAQRNHFTAIGFGDSMALRGWYPHVQDAFERNFGRAGIGFDDLWYYTQSGTIVRGATGSPRREDLWGPGNAFQIQNGAVMVIGEGANAANPVDADTVSFYFAMESGGGTVTIESSDDDGSSWSTLEAGVSTDNPTIAPLVKTYSLTEGNYKFRITATSGNTEFIACLARNDSKRGAVMLRSQVGGIDFDLHYTQSDQGILNAILADVDPDLVVTHGYQADVADATAATVWCDMINTAVPTADHVFTEDHEKSDSDPDPLVTNPIYATKAASLEPLKIFAVSEFLTWKVSNLQGWPAASDATHQDDAWPFVAAVFLRNFGIISHTGRLNFNKEEQTGSLEVYRANGFYPSKTQVIDFEGDPGLTHNTRISWLDGADQQYWQWTRLADSGNAPLGIRLFRFIGSGDEVVTFDASSRAYFGSVSGSITDRYDARVRVHEGSGAAAAIGASHNSSTGMVWEGWNHNSDSPILTSSITAGGSALFQLLNLAAIPTFADEAAAASLTTGDVYKTATGELRVKL